jgi:hypothetical protein
MLTEEPGTPSPSRDPDELDVEVDVWRVVSLELEVRDLRQARAGADED